MTSYEESGVNIELGDDASKILYNAAKLTWKNRKGKLGDVIVPFDDFTGVRAIDVSNLPEGTLMNIGFDGVGTKIEIAERMNYHATVAHDLLAMVCEDAVIRGAEPVLVGSILDVQSLGNDKINYIEQLKQLAMGYINAAEEADVAIINGEIAELGNRVGGFRSQSFINQLALQYISTNLTSENWLSIQNFSKYLVETDKKIKENLLEDIDYLERDFLAYAEQCKTLNYNWGAAVVWFARKERMFTGNEIKEGDYLVGLQEEGYRSNGLSLVRKILEKSYGTNWHTQPFQTNVHLGNLILIPSKIYTKAIVAMTGGYVGEPRADVHGIAHITGGGLPGKLGRILKPSGLGAKIDYPFEPRDFVKHIQRLGNVSDEEAYRTWNMGQGMVVITPEPEAVNNIANEYKIKTKKIGRVTKEPGIRIKSKGSYKEGEYLNF